VSPAELPELLDGYVWTRARAGRRGATLLLHVNRVDPTRPEWLLPEARALCGADPSSGWSTVAAPHPRTPRCRPCADKLTRLANLAASDQEVD
jgi:hypothetical protein